MLTNLLPGLRELRTPLAVGYIWLVAAWFAFYDHVPPRDRATGVALSAYKLVDFAGKPALLAALTFAAVLIGTARVEPDTARRILVTVLRPQGARIVVRRMASGDYARLPVSEHSVAATYQHLQRMVAKVDPDVSADVQESLADRHLRMVLDGYRSQPIRLQDIKPELYQEYDRKAAEADFRVNVGLALAGLSGALTYASGNPWFAAGLLGTLLLVSSGISRQQTANDLLIKVWTAEITTPLEMNEFDAIVREELGVSRRPRPERAPAVPTPATSFG